ncbi:hypothetical protein, partial [Aneurinibacillus migulanus]|uniref:hypothetical protein n=1 Tax=Aneurinibacillus migulanus TaxID=47500 RepID=UPI001F1ECE3C
SRVLIIQYGPEWIPPHRSPNGRRFVSRTREAQMFCRSGFGATKRPYFFLARKRRGNTPMRASYFF